MNTKNRKVTKAVITAAGYGTRFLPATKNIPKELLPIINKPTISYVVDQCIEAGIEEIIIVTRFGNHAVEDYFDSEPALEKYLIEKGKKDLAESIKEIYKGANFIFVRQNPDLPYGNAAPIYTVKELIGDNEPFIVSWGDDIILGKGVGVVELVNMYEKEPADVILNCLDSSPEEISRIGAEVQLEDGSNVVKKIIEKPPADKVKSNLLSVSPYLFTGKLFKYLQPKKDSKLGEFYIQKGINGIMKDGGTVRANVTKGKWITNGNPFDYLKATIEIALSRDDLNGDFIDYLKKRIQEYEQKK
ncbi:NTP transferase domain-containing protein [Candidatus Woesebacteria bacterium]|nr:NTP transferase domain-containing protein [Candidatus Woesebacteria bacterium]